MIKIAVCDDNIQFAHILVDKLRDLCAKTVPERALCNIINEFTSVTDVLNYLSENHIDILFLDIEMPVHNGFSLAKELKKKYPDIVVVFVSSHANLVFRSFDYSPLCFLRKSHLDKELAPAFLRAIDTCLYAKDTLDFSTKDGDVTLRVKDILFIESQKNYFGICTHDSTYKCRGTMSQIEQIVSKYDFFRIHSAYLINLDNIFKIKNDYTVQMSNNDVLPVSQRRYAEFKNEYAKYIRRRTQNV